MSQRHKLHGKPCRLEFQPTSREVAQPNVCSAGFQYSQITYSTKLDGVTIRDSMGRARKLEGIANPTEQGKTNVAIRDTGPNDKSRKQASYLIRVLVNARKFALVDYMDEKGGREMRYPWW